MKEYDVIVIGSGAGMIIVDEAIEHDLNVALVDKGPMGGTCPNTGCIPSKILIFPADRIVEIQEAGKLGIEAKVKQVDFKAIMTRMRQSVEENQLHMRHGVAHAEHLAFYEGEGHFVDDYTIEVNNERIKGKMIFIAAGSRPSIPSIQGLDGVDYLTNETALQLEEKPDSLIIIGGGYIAVEFGHFFAAMGTKVTIVELADRLVVAEELEVSELLLQELGRRMTVYTSTRPEEIKTTGKNVAVVVTDTKTGARKELSAERLMVAVGRRSNADLMKVENTGVRTDEKGFVKVSGRLETSKKNIYAIGDINGQQMFTHMANREAMLAGHNAIHEDNQKIDYRAAPHAVYSWPQIASVGLTEAQAKEKHKVLVGRAKYADVAKGEAMMEKRGFAKAIVDRKDGQILGFHIIGPYAPILIQEVINAMASGSHMESIGAGIHIHPALPELVQRTLNNLEEV
jgi:dihydrolipoamide dehydrogenase